MSQEPPPSGRYRDGRLPRRLATNLAEIDIVYRDGWSADGSTTVGRWVPKPGVAQVKDLDPASGPAFALENSESYEEQILAAARFPDREVRVVPTPGIVEAWLVRPDGYVAGRGGAGDAARLLGLLARMFGVSGIAVGAQLP
jgi:hypothetical protein